MSELKETIKQNLIYAECLKGLPTNQTYTIFKIENNIFEREYFLSKDEAKRNLLSSGKLLKLEGNKCNSNSTFSPQLCEALKEKQANFLIMDSQEIKTKPQMRRRDLLESARLSNIRTPPRRMVFRNQ